MSRFFALVLALYVVQIAGCSWRNVDDIDKQIEAIHDKPLPTDREALRKELAETLDREARLKLALARADDEAKQTKLWIGAGGCVLVGILFVILGIYTTRRILIEIGLGAFGVAALCVVAAWLVPYALYIGIGVVVVGGVVTAYMLLNREKAVKQIAQGVDSAADRIPEFRDNFKRIFNEHIDTNVDKVIKTVRGVT